MTSVFKQLKQTVCVGFLSLAVVGIASPSTAVPVEYVPNPRQQYGGWVTDSANILSDETEAELNRTISELEAKNGSEIAVVTVSNTKPYQTPKQFTTTLFNYWGIGKSGVNNGVLLMVSTGDRRVEIETGYGISAILSDAQVGNIIDTQIKPRFKQGDFDGGTLAGTRAVVLALNSHRSQTVDSASAFNIGLSWFSWEAGVKGILFAIAVFAFGGIIFIFIATIKGILSIMKRTEYVFSSPSSPVPRTRSRSHTNRRYSYTDWDTHHYSTQNNLYYSNTNNVAIVDVDNDDDSSGCSDESYNGYSGFGGGCSDGSGAGRDYSSSDSYDYSSSDSSDFGGGESDCSSSDSDFGGGESDGGGAGSDYSSSDSDGGGAGSDW